MGPTQLADSRQQILHHLIALLETAAGEGAKLVVFPELALSTFFPRWLIENDCEGAF
jgi:predicted amidohydrolase